MNGAEALMSVAKQAGTEICFANPGTTEMPMDMAMDSAPGIRPVLALHENVCSAAADSYGRLAGKPAMTITHLGPGFANSCANQHNARRAFAPMKPRPGRRCKTFTTPCSMSCRPPMPWASTVAATTWNRS